MYFTCALKVAANCEFNCPNCNYGLADYLLLSKLTVGLVDPGLRKEVFRSFETFKEVVALRSFCMAYETASQAGKESEHSRDSSSIATVEECDVTADDTDDVMVAAASGTKNYTKPTAAPGKNC